MKWIIKDLGILGLWGLWAATVMVGGCATSRLTPPPVETHRRGLLDSHSSKTVSVNSYSTHAHHFPVTTEVSPGFRWPLEYVEVTSPFGRRGREFHEGLDLRAKEGTPVYAAQSGIVLYAGSKIRGYGEMVVIRHLGRVATIYAHNSELLVRRGDTIKQGQKIAISGETGHTRGPHLHFEIRRGLAALNPLKFLPRLIKRVRPPRLASKVARLNLK